MASETSPLELVAAARRACTGGRQPTMEEIATEAGVAVRTLYRLWGSRQALLTEAGCDPEPSTRQRILDAALEMVGRHGLAELSMDELAASAGVSRATLYRLFPGKAGLFAALIAAFSPWEPVADVLDALHERDPHEVMPAIARAIATALEGRVGLLIRMVFELIQGDPDTTEGMRHSMARGLPEMIGYLDSQMQAGRLRSMDPVLAFQLLAGPIVVHLLTRPLAEATTGIQAPPQQVLDELVHAWLRAMDPASST